MQRATWVVPFVVAAQISCANDPSSEPVEPHRARWNATGISDYEYSIEHFTAGQPLPPLNVVVKDENVVTAKLRCFPPHPEEQCKSLERFWIERSSNGDLLSYARTIPQLFDEISKARADANKQDARVLVTFDSKHGFPTRFTFDNPRGDDEEYGFQISGFVVIR